MSTQNNFLKISVFNLEQKIKTEAENQIKFCNDMTKEIVTLITKVSDREYPEKESVLINLEAYRGALKYIKSNNTDLFEFIEHLYLGDTKKQTAPKKLPKKRTPKKPKSPKQP